MSRDERDSWGTALAHKAVAFGRSIRGVVVAAGVLDAAEADRVLNPVRLARPHAAS